MKILIIEPSGRLATFQYAHNLANALTDRGHRVACATGIDFETKSYPCHYEPIEVFDRFLPQPRRLVDMLRRVRRLRPHIIHIQGHSHPTSYLALRALLRGVADAAFIYTAQDVLPKRRLPHHVFSCQILYHTASHIFVNADDNRRFLLKRFPGVDPEKITVVPLADLTTFVDDSKSTESIRIPTDRRVVLFFGNIERRKGLSVLIRAVAQVRKTLEDVLLVVAGKPFDDMVRYRTEIERLGLAGHVLLHDEYVALEGIPNLFKRAQVIALPYTEGWNSGVIATASARGTPIIASNVGGFREVIQHRDSGMLVPPGDAGALAQAIVAVLTDEPLRARLSAQGLRQARKNSWSKIAEKSELIYSRVLGECRPEANP